MHGGRVPEHRVRHSGHPGLEADEIEQPRGPEDVSRLSELADAQALDQVPGRFEQQADDIDRVAPAVYQLWMLAFT